MHLCHLNKVPLIPDCWEIFPRALSDGSPTSRLTSSKVNGIIAARSNASCVNASLSTKRLQTSTNLSIPGRPRNGGSTLIVPRSTLTLQQRRPQTANRATT